MFPRIEESKERFKKDLEILLDMFREDEKEIIKELIENKGKILQSKLSSKFGKVKTFRILENLRKRGIIEKEGYGKTNMIKISERFKLLIS